MTVEMWKTLMLLRRSMGSWRAVVNAIVGYSYSLIFRYGWKIHTYLGFKRPVTSTISRTHGRIDYTVDGSEWGIVFPCSRGPYNFSHITDSAGFDITDDVKILMGPGKNFYGIQSTPNLLGYNSLTFHDYCGGMKHFSTDSIIDI